jgi:hypothetical protein
MARTALNTANVMDAQLESAEGPNLPEVSGTTFPLLTTVLAGFAVTIAVQLIIRPEPAESIPTIISTAIVAFLASTLLFISSIIFSVNAQSHNYLPFLEIGDDGRRFFSVSDHQTWIAWIQRSWDTFHVWAIGTFYCGIFLLLLGVNLIVWEFVGSGVGFIFSMLIVAHVGLTIAVGLWVHRTKQRTDPRGARPAGAGSVSITEESKP